jgi:hypothetical protein
MNAMHFAELLVLLFAAYAGFGIVFAVLFLMAGVQRMDPAAKGAGLGFRLIIFPGVAALWPLLLMRWTRPGGAWGGRP